MIMKGMGDYPQLSIDNQMTKLMDRFESVQLTPEMVRQYEVVQQSTG